MSKVYTTDKLSDYRKTLITSLQTKIDENRTVNLVTGGPLNTGVASKIISHIRSGAETIMQNGDRNAFIIFGEDRPAGRGSGYGGIGASPSSKGTNRITLTVGKMARASGGEGPKDGTFADPSPFGDAAKIYIADMTDADKNFGFCDTEVGNVKGQSAIVNFADQVRIFGVGGVQISTGQPQAKTGPDGVTNSQGGKMPLAPPIILSAGNVDYIQKHPMSDGPYSQIPVIQGVVKGDSMILCIRKLAEILDDIIGALIRLGTFQGIFASALGIQVPPAVNPHYPAICQSMTRETFESFLMTLISLRTEKGAWENNYCNDRSVKLIKSTNVFAS
tara:strand:- start:12517 stop:13515 length:999 start_codon:yes stop_codon:yes gene_type:complete